MTGTICFCLGSTFAVYTSLFMSVSKYTSKIINIILVAVEKKIFHNTIGEVLIVSQCAIDETALGTSVMNEKNLCFSPYLCYFKLSF